MTHRVSRSTTIALWVCLGTTIALFVTSAYWPPKGAIDPSMFKAAGFLFGFAALFELREAIREGLGVKLTHGDTSIQVGDLDGVPPSSLTPSGENLDGADTPAPQTDDEPLSDTE